MKMKTDLLLLRKKIALPLTNVTKIGCIDDAEESHNFGCTIKVNSIYSRYISSTVLFIFSCG